MRRLFGEVAFLLANACFISYTNNSLGLRFAGHPSFVGHHRALNNTSRVTFIYMHAVAMLLPRHCVAATRYLRWPAFTSCSTGTGTRMSTASRGRPRFQPCYASSASAATAIDQNALYASPIPDKLTFHSGLTLTQIPGGPP
jgi:hypothetical protein